MIGWTLALDTATAATVAAAVAPDAADGTAGARAARFEAPEVDAARSRPGRPDHTRRLLALAEDALRATGGDWSSVSRIVVGLGPGTFTGIRVGVATARAAALASGADVIGVPSSAALAAAARDAGTDGPILVAQDARRKEYFLTLVGPGDVAEQAATLQPWTCAQDELAATVAALDPRPAAAVGDGALAWRDELEALGVRVPTAPAAHVVDGLALLDAAASTPPGTADEVRPVYVRAPDAIPTAERR
ncbi:MAG: tRNA (adenosine(37)-N6)-threonylcarbamoyltransferase complex dimerization subunit type 1 TsaB [Patulibacter sp.]